MISFTLAVVLAFREPLLFSWVKHRFWLFWYRRISFWVISWICRCFWGSRFSDCWRNRLIRLNMVRITLVFGILVEVLLFWIQLDAAVVVAKVHLQLWWFLFNYGYLFNRLVPFLKICLNLGYNFFRIFLYFHFLVCILQTVELFDCFSTPKSQFFHQ